MNPTRRIPEARLNAGLTDIAGSSTPDLLDEVLAATAATRQRPAWSFLARWIPMAVTTRPATAPLLRPLWLLLVALLVAALAVGGAIVATRLLHAEAPLGDAAVLAFDALDGRIYSIRADGKDLRRLTDPPGVASNPTYSPDGKRMAYRLVEGSSDTIMVMDDRDGNPATVASLGLFGGPGDLVPDEPLCPLDLDLAWSPDSKALVVPAGACLLTGLHLYIVPSDGSTPPVRLLAPGTQSTSPSWSPDGRWIAFQGMDDATGLTGLYVIDLQGADPLAGGFTPTRIADGQGPKLEQAYSVPSWSPDSKELATVVGVGEACYGDYEAMTWDLVVVNVEDLTRRPLASEPAGEFNPTWSPRGDRIAFHRTVDPSEYYNDRPCTVRTWVADRDGRNAYAIPDLKNNWPPPLWSPDETRLLGSLVDSEIPGEFQLSIIRVDVEGAVVRLPNASGTGSWQPLAAPWSKALSLSS
jgi:Tol biopolymer transport system component